VAACDHLFVDVPDRRGLAAAIGRSERACRRDQFRLLLPPIRSFLFFSLRRRRTWSQKDKDEGSIDTTSRCRSVGVRRVPVLFYMRALFFPVNIITKSVVPYTILRATQQFAESPTASPLDDSFFPFAGTRRADQPGQQRIGSSESLARRRPRRFPRPFQTSGLPRYTFEKRWNRDVRPRATPSVRFVVDNEAFSSARCCRKKQNGW